VKQLQVGREYEKTLEFDEDTDILDIRLPKFTSGKTIHIPKKLYAENRDASTRKVETLCGRTGKTWTWTARQLHDDGMIVFLRLCRDCEKQASETLGFDVREHVREELGEEV